MSRTTPLRMVLPMVGWAACSSEEPAAPPPPAPTPPKVEAPAEDTGGPAGSARPRISRLTYSPGRPNTLDHIRLEVAAEDPDGGPVRFKYQWYINDQKMLHLTRDNLPAAAVERGDVVWCEVQALDSDGEEALRKTAEIEIVNAAPSFTTDPRSVRKLDGLTLQADDPDGDTLTFSLAGAPKGMTIDPKRGKLAYKGSTDEPGGHYDIVAKVADGHGGTATWTFGIDVSAGSGARAASAGAEGGSPSPGGEAPDGPPKRERRRTAW